MGTLHEEKLVHLFTSPIIKHEWARSQALNRELSASIVKHARTTGGEHNMAIGGWQSSKDYHKWAGKRDRVLLNRQASDSVDTRYLSPRRRPHRVVDRHVEQRL